MVIASLSEGELGEESVLVEEVLIHEFDASRGAVRTALQTLAAEGVVQRTPRVGTRVVGTFSRIAAHDAGGHPDEEDIVIQRVIESGNAPATSMLRRLLQLDAAAEEVRVVENLFIKAGSILGVRSAYYSSDYDSDDYPRDASMTSVIETYFGKCLGEVRSSIGATIADRRTARLLGISPDQPVLFRQQLYVDDTGVPIQLVFDHYRADRVLLTDTQLL